MASASPSGTPAPASAPEPTLLRILLGVLFLSGIGRAISVAQHGWTAPVLTGAMLLELIGPAIIWPWHARLLRRL